MTAPVAHGYPDWGRFVARANVKWLKETGVAITAASERGSFFLGHTTHLGVKFTCTTGHASISFSWRTGAAAADEVATTGIDVRDDTIYVGAIPVVAPYVVVTVTPGSVNPTFNLALWSAAGPLPFLDHSDTNVLLSDILTPWGLGIATTGVATYVTPGLAYLSCFASITNYTATVESIDASGVTQRLLIYGGAHNGLSMAVYLPATPVRLQLDNNVGPGATIEYALTSDPLSLR